MAPPSYEDISKTANDILNNDYCFDKKLKVKTKTANGVSLTVENVMSSSGVSGKLTSKFQPFDGIAVDKLGVKTNGRVFAEATLENAFAGAQFTVSAEDGAGKSPAGSLSMSYNMDSINLDASLDFVRGPTLYAAGTFGYDGFVLGGEVKYNTEFDDSDSNSKLEDYNGSLSYVGGDFTASLSTSNKASVYGVSIHHNVSADTQIATQFDFNSKDSGKVLTLGGIYTVDSETKFQGKIDSNGIVSSNWIQQVRPQVQLIASAQVDAKNFQGDSHKFGLSLILG